MITGNIVHTHLGSIAVALSPQGLVRLILADDEREAAMQLQLAFPEAKPGADLGTLAQKLRAYADGQQVTFDEPVDLHNGTSFQRSVWQATRDISYGIVFTYQELATRLGVPRSARAVGQALGANPVPIIIPCHRIVGHDGGLVGYGGGLGWKEKLLRLEGFVVERQRIVRRLASADPGSG
ncbi:MAG: methylated-DNA--[protein]-cysteine S-methyltransferase [Chloroflexi bacterium]|nr:methylated-DNA--[protein]-cysteine S-methyltransferase [Chloroflexota bacterium]